jgi:hypothetical protein
LASRQSLPRDDEMPAFGRYGMLEAGHQMNGFPPVTAMVVPDV